MTSLQFRQMLVLIAAMLTSGGCMQTGTNNLRVMTYNIRLDIASDEANTWTHRREMAAAVIRYQAPDVLGMQEVLLRQKRDLEAALPDYTIIGVGRDDGREGGEYSPLAYRTARFSVVTSGTFWLSPTPSTPSKGWDAAFPRIATWAVLRDNESGRSIRVLNTHFDHVGTVARRESANMIVSWLMMGEGGVLPTVVMGDFNSLPEAEPYRILDNTAATGLRDARTASQSPAHGPAGTFNAFKIDNDAGAPIDHIFVTKGIGVSRYGVITQQWGGRLPSDHYPVVIDLTLPDSTTEQ